MAPELSAICTKTKAALQQYFDTNDPLATIEVNSPSGNRIHIRIIADSFSNTPWKNREETIWSVLESSLLADEVEKISLLMLLTPAEAGKRFEEIKKSNEALREETSTQLSTQTHTQELSDEQRLLRQFIYLDTPSLYSYYSQIKDGLPGMLYSHKRMSDEGEDMGESFDGISRAITRTAKEVMESEAKTLHDHMYNVLEKDLITRRILIDINTHLPEQLRDMSVRAKLQSAMLIKVSGSAKFDDLDFLQNITNNYNDLIGIIKYFELKNKHPNIQSLTQKEMEALPPDARKIANAIRKGDTKEVAKLTDSGINPIIVDAINLVVSKFHERASYMRIQPFQDKDVIFSAPLNDVWLREKRSLLRLWYSRRIRFKLTLVGQVGIAPQMEDDEVAADDEKPFVTEDPSLGEHLKLLMPALEGMRRAFYGDKYPAFTIVPLAIYREFEVTEARTAAPRVS